MGEIQAGMDLMSFKVHHEDDLADLNEPVEEGAGAAAPSPAAAEPVVAPAPRDAAICCTAQIGMPQCGVNEYLCSAQ